MDPTDPTAWLHAAQAPVVAALFWLVHGIKRDLERIDRGEQRQIQGLDRTRDELAAFKLEVARTYVPLSLIRDVDRRLSEQLRRIENKIELRQRQEDGE
ncbi:hypothetical protein [Roseococcus sp. YIM B11640]|uniref:hypothetical protein n=1 Tax=Roseococcus sp. YIM B11640 TaxID=3133973 RepID=UPI003C79AD11